MAETQIKDTFDIHGKNNKFKNKHKYASLNNIKIIFELLACSML